MTNDTYRYSIGFAASVLIPPDAIAIVEVCTTEPMDAFTRHERFVDILTTWCRETPEGQQLLANLDEPATIGEILMALDSFSTTSFEFWLAQGGLSSFRFTVSREVFDLDLLIAE